MRPQRECRTGCDRSCLRHPVAGEGDEDWGKGGGGAGSGSGAVPMDETPDDLSEEAKMQNMLAEAEDEQQQNPAKALPLFLSWLDKAAAQMAQLVKSGSGGGTEALDLKVLVNKARSSVIVLHTRLREVSALHSISARTHASSPFLRSCCQPTCGFFAYEWGCLVRTQFDKSIAEFKKLVKEFADAKFDDLDCLTIYRLLNDCQGPQSAALCEMRV